MHEFEFEGFGDNDRGINPARLQIQARTIASAWKQAIKLYTGPNYYGRHGLRRIDLVGMIR